MKLKKKLLLSFAAIAIIPLMCMTVFAYTQYVHIINRHITTIADNEFKNLSLKVRESYDSIRQTLSFLTFYSADDNAVLSTLRSLKYAEVVSDSDTYNASESIKTACQSAMYNQSYIKSIYIFTNTKDRSVFGHSRTAEEGISSGYDPINDDWYQKTLALNGSVYISPLDVYPMFGTDYECFFVAHLIRDADRDFQHLGVIVVEYSSEIFDLSRETALSDIANITLTNTLNDSVIYTNMEENHLEIIPTEENSTVESVFQTPFELSMTIDYASLKAEYSSTLILLVLLAALCLLCILLLTMRITRDFINPIEKLSSCMVQQQMVHVELPSGYESRKDEIGILYRQYDKMMTEINNFIKTEYQNKLITLDAQMKALEARINSHFLFNTLESINSMAELAEQEQISTMSMALGHMFRYAIKTDSELVTIEDELNHVRDYMVIQRIRCDDKFRFIEDVPGEFYGQKMLKLIFQPLVENSLIHGLEYGNSGDEIRLSVRTLRDMLLIVISDNGKGISKKRLEELRQHLQEEITFTELGHRKKESIGLKNIQSRIELYYGKGYGLTINSTEGEGTEIKMHIPIFPCSQGGVKLYRYIVIDDESLIRKGTIKKLQALSELATCCGEAENGQKGIELVKECHPDFVILDMYMPVMDGMELLSYLSEYFPELPLIVVSGYQNFDYMKQAITSKAIDYILKPFSAKEIQKAVLSTIDTLKTKEHLKTQISTVKEDREKAYYDLDINFLKGRILGYESDTQSILSERLKFIENTHQFILFTLYLMNLSTELGMEEWLKENGFSEFMVYLTHPSMEQFRFIILFLPEGSSQRDANIEQFSELILLWGSRQDCNIRIGVSECHDNIYQLNKAFRETVEALDEQPLCGLGREYWLYKEPGERISLSWPLQEEFLFRMEAGEYEKVSLMVEKLFDYYKGVPGCKLKDVKQNCEYLSVQCQLILSRYLSQKEDVGKPSHNMHAIINTLYSLEDVKKYYQQFFLNITAMLRPKSVYAGTDLIDKIKIYVRNNYQKDLTRDFVASLFYINSSYLSQAFKKKTGEKFVDYLNYVRIEKAKELLGATDLKMYQVSKNVGYENPKYFFRIFKKKTGMTPEQYQSSVR